MGDFAAELSGAARDISHAGRRFGLAGYGGPEDGGGHGGGGPEGAWSGLGAPLDVERLLSEVRKSPLQTRRTHLLFRRSPLCVSLCRY